ncbi:LAMI_0B07448g1_1 [Lachancea mirantina]|uniref:Transcription initiation factor TFIID subunit 4 n=1 Tax=Lachancea mirantina TaxID=1230905 RepID=A0A1G4IXE3_9SACH|nr:LAMI_0B07448g1_1 [Lachancea mirantina]
MAKSPKRGSSNVRDENSAKKPKTEPSDTVSNGEGPAFELGAGSRHASLDPGSSDFSTNLPTPFDNLDEEEGQDANLPESSAPATNLVDMPKKSDQGLALPQKTNKKLGSVQNQGSGTGQSSSKITDPDKLSDALLSAGVDIREEEALLSSTVSMGKPGATAANTQIPSHPPVLHPAHVAGYMKKVAGEQNFYQDFSKSTDVVGMVSAACETFMRDIITNSLVVSRHRRRSVKLNVGRKSEVSRLLRDLAVKQKEQEERRVKRRIAMGLEKEAAEDKLETEETLHRASNATANMMIAGGKKKYSWLNAGSKNTNNAVKVVGKVSSDVAARGEIGIRYREAREEPGIVMRDLMSALENRRMGVSSVISKGYARIRD